MSNGKIFNIQKKLKSDGKYNKNKTNRKQWEYGIEPKY